LTREAFEKYAPEGEDVGAAVHLLVPACLLRGDVAWSTEQRADLRQRARAVPEPGDAEVDELGARRVSVDEEDVARLDVAMNDTGRVRGGEHARHAAGEHDRPGRTERAAPEARLEVFALQPFHGQVELSAARRSVSDVADDSRVTKLGEQAPLTQEPLRRPNGSGVKELEGDELAGHAVRRSVDGAHSPRAGQPLDFEAVGDEGARSHARSIGPRPVRWRPKVPSRARSRRSPPRRRTSCHPRR